MRKLFLATSNIFTSLVLGAIAFGYVFIQHPELMSQILDWAAGLKSWLITRGISPAYNNWIRVLLEERQLTFMGFTIVARIVLSIVTAIGSTIYDRIVGTPDAQ